MNLLGKRDMYANTAHKVEPLCAGLRAAYLDGMNRCDHSLILEFPARDGQEAKIHVRVRTATQDGFGERLGVYRNFCVEYQATKELEEVEVHTKETGPDT